ncbi:MAG: cell division protease FtsH [Actinomycetota bacterium]|jgi:ATP-dependent Zn protease|nr:cell division protease FtsH [Actinomycetota bacterium]
MDATTLGPPDPEPRTRPPVPFWDRTKFLFLFAAVWTVLVWNFYLENQVVGATLGDALAEQAAAARIWLVLFSLELLRQTHYLFSEHSAAWHGFWTKRVFGAWNKRVGRLNDWNRYRFARALKWAAFVALVGYLLGQVYSQPPTQALFELPSTIWRALPMIVQVVMIVALGILQFAAIFWFLSRGGVDTYMPNDIKTRFADVWGQDAVLGRIKENLVFLDRPERIEEMGGYVPGGVLLWGPPGTGKTLLAEAVAGETGKPFVFVEPGAFINMFFGVGVLKVKGLFRKLRKLAVRYGGVVVFFDEADALGNRGMPATGAPGAAGWTEATSCNGLNYLGEATAGRILQERFVVGGAGMGGGGGMGTLQALLTELSGLKKPRGFFNRIVRRSLGLRPKPPPKYRMLVMMATNMPEALDEALLRPGRIDRIYKVGYPSKAGRIRTYEGYLAKVRHELTAEDVDKLATITPYATGATIKDMVNEALITALRNGRDVITWQDIVRAKQLKDLGLPEDVEYVDRERHATAVHEACHAVVAYRIRRHLTIDIATIEKGGNYLGMVASIPPEDLFTQWRSEFEADILVSLASLAGERMFFDGDNSSGVAGDLASATQVATWMEGHWGMGRTIASHPVTHRAGIGGGGPDREKGKSAANVEIALGNRIEQKLAELYQQAQKLLEANRFEVLAVAHALETHKTLSGDDVKAVIEGTEGPLVDGRAYRERGFVEVAEEYHRRALEAHQTHDRVGAPLPTLQLDFSERPGGGRGRGRAARARRSDG